MENIKQKLKSLGFRKITGINCYQSKVIKHKYIKGLHIIVDLDDCHIEMWCKEFSGESLIGECMFYIRKIDSKILLLKLSLILKDFKND